MRVPRGNASRERVAFLMDLVGVEGQNLTGVQADEMIRERNPVCFRNLRDGSRSKYIRRWLPFVKDPISRSNNAHVDIPNRVRSVATRWEQVKAPVIRSSPMQLDFENVLDELQFPFTYGVTRKVTEMLKADLGSKWNVLVATNKTLIDENAELRKEVERLGKRCAALSATLEENIQEIIPTVVHSDPTR